MAHSRRSRESCRRQGTRWAGPGVRSWTVVLALCVVLAEGAPLRGETYFVDAVRGDDAAAGTSSSPFRSIRRALETATQADVVRVAPGLYDTAGTGDTGIRGKAGVAVLGAGPGRSVVGGGVSFPSREDLAETTRVEGFTFEVGMIGAGCSNASIRFVLRGNLFQGPPAPTDPMASFNAQGTCELAPLIEGNVFLAGWETQNVLEFDVYEGSVLAPVIRGNVFGTPNPSLPGPDRSIHLIAYGGGRIEVTVEDNWFLNAGTGLHMNVNIFDDWSGPNDAVGEAVYRRNRYVWDRPMVEGTAGIVGVWAAAGMDRPATVAGENNTFRGVSEAFLANDFDGSAPPVLIVSSNDTIQRTWTALTSRGAGSDIRLQNAVIWDRSSGFALQNAGTVSLEWSDVEGGWPGTGNIDRDPLFVDAGSGDLRLSPGSPAIDAGTSDQAPSADIDGRERFDDPATPDTGTGLKTWYDMGAFEYLGGNGPGCIGAAPGEVAGVRVGRPAPDSARIVWEPEPSSPLYRVAKGRIEDLRPGGFFGAGCLGETAGTQVTDADSDEGAAWWYLVRGENVCGAGTYGDSNLAPDPRDELDAWFPYEERPCP